MAQNASRPSRALASDRPIGQLEPVAQAVVDLGDKGASDGLEADDEAALMLATTRATAYDSARPTANGGPSHTTRGFSDPTRCLSHQTAI
jgi:hypothetical protein